MNKITRKPNYRIYKYQKLKKALGIPDWGYFVPDSDICMIKRNRKYAYNMFRATKKGYALKRIEKSLGFLEEKL